MIDLESIPRDTVGPRQPGEARGSRRGRRRRLRNRGAGRSGRRTEPDLVVVTAGRALIGKAEQDDIEVVTPKGKRAYMVKKLITIHAVLATENGTK